MKYNCVFGGGGIRGMCYIGAIRALEEFEIDINAVAGSSVGAVFAALYAAGYDRNEIKDLFFDFNFNMFRDLNINIFNSDISLSKGEIFLDWLREKIGKKVFGKNYTPDKKVMFSDIQKDLYILTLDLNTNMPYIFSKKETPDEEIAFAVRCSAGLPGLMKPISHRGMLLVDGDLAKSRPAWKVFEELDNASSRILEFRLEGSRDGTNIKNPMDYINSIINVIWYLSTENVFTLYGENDRYDYIVIDTKDLILFDFTVDREKKEKLVDLGYNKTKYFLSSSLVKKKENLLNVYSKLSFGISLLEKEMQNNNFKEAVFILNEVIARMSLNKKYIDISIFENLKELKLLFSESIARQFLFTKKIDNQEILKEKIEFLDKSLKIRIDEIFEYVSKYKNIS